MTPLAPPERNPPGKEIVILQDNPELILFIKQEFARHFYRVRDATNGQAGLTDILRQPPDLVILDLILPGLNGFEVCRALRKDQRTKKIPIIILTTLADEENRLKGFEAGADAYLNKPFSLKELMARVRALLRRKRFEIDQESSGVLRFGPLVIDIGRNEVRMAAQSFRFTRTEFALLKHLAQNPQKVFRRDELISAIWGENGFVEEHNLDVHIHSIRRQLEPDPGRPRFLRTVRGVGYTFCATEEEAM